MFLRSENRVEDPYFSGRSSIYVIYFSSEWFINMEETLEARINIFSRT